MPPSLRVGGVGDEERNGKNTGGVGNWGILTHSYSLHQGNAQEELTGQTDKDLVILSLKTFVFEKKN